jgi:hypothetical protein
LLSTLLHTEVQEFIQASLEEQVSVLALKKNPFPNLSWAEILNQIAAKQKAKTKLPSWFQTPNILYPSKISLEQTSSEKTAAYKATLVSGDSLIDLTGGFGIDDYYFAQKIKNVVHCEINSELSDIVNHNRVALNATNIKCYQGDSTIALKELDQKWDWIYIDPSRRSDTKGKVFMLKDCLPNVPDLLDFYFEYSSSLLIKTAPILDISAGLLELKFVKEIHCVAVDNEVKELLWVLEKNYNAAPEIIACNISKTNTDRFNFTLGAAFQPVYSLPKTFLFEPNAALMKSGGFEAIATTFTLEKLHPHSHLYTADEVIPFPGRIFQINTMIEYSKNQMKAHLEHKTAHITTRNFPDSVESIRKKWKIKDGGSQYCFFTTNISNEKIVLLCTKINEL